MGRISKLLVGVMLVLAGFALGVGASQYRAGGWPFGRASYTDKSKEVAQWVENLRRGGYILYFRHAHREKWTDVEAFDFYEFAAGIEDASATSFKKAVCLSEQGVEESKIIGETFRRGRIPVGVVVTSPSCRAKQTVVYAFGKYDAVDKAIRFAALLGEKPLKGSPEQLLALLRTVKITPGTNTVISGHSINLGPNGVGGLEGKFQDGNSAVLLETGFYVIERLEGNRLRLAFSFKSISELATHAISIAK